MASPSEFSENLSANLMPHQMEQFFLAQKEKQKKFVQVEGLDLSWDQALALEKKNEASYSWTKP